MPLCRHCQSRKANRSRGLCWPCWHQPAIRNLYPVQRRRVGFCHRGYFGEQDFFGGYAPPAEPTPHPPGSPEKLAALAARVQSRVSLWHRRDADHGGE